MTCLFKMTEMVIIEVVKEDLERLITVYPDFPYTLHKVRVDDYDYSSNEKWQKQSAIARNAYRELKHIEYDIRHG